MGTVTLHTFEWVVFHDDSAEGMGICSVHDLKDSPDIDYFRDEWPSSSVVSSAVCLLVLALMLVLVVDMTAAAVAAAVAPSCLCRKASKRDRTAWRSACIKDKLDSLLALLSCTLPCPLASCCFTSVAIVLCCGGAGDGAGAGATVLPIRWPGLFGSEMVDKVESFTRLLMDADVDGGAVCMKAKSCNTAKLCCS